MERITKMETTCMNYSKTVQVVTGGAGGMGIAICKRIANRGPLFVADINKDALCRAKALLMKAGFEDVTYVECDISDKSQVEELARAVKQAGDLGSCIHAAAYSPIQQPAKRIFEVNAIGTVRVIDAFYPLMQNGSTMITITSVAGYSHPINEDNENIFANPHDPAFIDKLMGIVSNIDSDVVEDFGYSMQAGIAYSASKSFSMYYSRRCTNRYAKKGSRILTVSCGCFTTDMGLADMAGGSMVTDITPLARWGHPNEVASLVEFLSSEKASYITGSDILVDGGYNAAINYKQYEQVY